jgi:hypothetical protein
MAKKTKKEEAKRTPKPLPIGLKEGETPEEIKTVSKQRKSPK